MISLASQANEKARRSEMAGLSGFEQVSVARHNAAADSHRCFLYLLRTVVGFSAFARA